MEGNNDPQRTGPRPTPAEFARMSSSMKLTVITILRAQMSSRKAVEAEATARRLLEDDDDSWRQ